jgi:hypothetical protein
MNNFERDLILKGMQDMMKLDREMIYNLEEEIKKIKKENNLL